MGVWKKLVNDVKYGPSGPPQPAGEPAAATPADPCAKPTRDQIRAKFSNLSNLTTLYLTTDGRIVARRTMGKNQAGSVAGAVAEFQMAGGIAARSTLTRNVLTGGLLGDKVVEGREAYLTITGPDLAIVEKIDPKMTGGAREFAAAVNAASRAMNATSVAPEVPPASGATSEQSATAMLGDLAKLHQAGVITDEEFAAKKAELLKRI